MVRRVRQLVCECERNPRRNLWKERLWFAILKDVRREEGGDDSDIGNEKMLPPTPYIKRLKRTSRSLPTACCPHLSEYHTLAAPHLMVFP